MESGFIRKNSSFYQNSKYNVPKKTEKNENLKACLFQTTKKKNRSKTSLSFSEQFKKYDSEIENPQQEEDWTQSMSKAFIPAKKFRR